MIRKDKKIFADGTVKTQVRVTYGFRDENNKVKQKTIRSFGYLEDQPNPDEFLKEIEKFSKDYLKEKNVVLSNKSNAPFYENNSNIAKNFGYSFLASIYDSLKLEEFFSNYDFNVRYDVNRLFKYLVINRLMNPDSKRATYQSYREYYGLNPGCSLQQLYRGLDIYSDTLVDLQVHLNTQVKNLIGRSSENMFYDVTNYYFEKDFDDFDVLIEIDEKQLSKNEMKKMNIIELEDNGVKKKYQIINGFRKKGVSKEHQLTPIVQLGLFMDSNGLPVAMQLFSGNTSDSKTLQPIMGEIKEKFELNRLLVIADKGMNSNDNITKILEKGDGYMFSQILKGKKGYRFHERLFNDSLYTVVNEDYKYQLYEENYDIKLSNGEIKTIKQKVLLYYNGEDARREKAKRDEKINKAKKALSNGAYSIDHSYLQFVKKVHYVNQTGELADKTNLEIDDEKINEDAKFDGYFCIITSETDMDEKTIRETYHGLWKIEESFRITKSDLSARPIFLRTKKHIEAHFLICFVALLVIRLLQYKLNYSLSVERIIRALDMCCCVNADTGIIHAIKVGEKIGFLKKETKEKKEYISLSEDEISETVQDLKKIEKAFNIKMCATLNNKTIFDKFLREINFERCLKN